MKGRLLIVSLIGLLSTLAFQRNCFAQIPTPESFFGFTPGADHQLFKYEKLMEYMQLLDEQSPMVHLEQYGDTEMGRPMYIIFISSAENIAKLQRLRDINRQLALDDIDAGSDVQQLTNEGKVFFLSTLSMHANEVGPAQALPLVAWELLMGDDPRRALILENSVAMFILHNPDGMNMIVDHYVKHRGTALETSIMPGVFHKYVGHNINRDFVTLNMKENQMVADVYSTMWYPQAMVERHQMTSNGPRFFVSPPHDPIAENVDAGIWNWTRVYGSRTLNQMTEKGLQGISVNYLFDDYWPGATTTSNWKGIVGMLSEAASVNIATPIFVEANELRTTGKGLGQYDISINMPAPWPGGWWRLADILQYEVENTLANLHTSAIHKSEILSFRNQLTRREIARGKEEAPFYYILPVSQQHDVSEMVGIVNLLHRHGVSSYTLTDTVIFDGNIFTEGSIVIPLAQPYRAFIKEVMEKQIFPERYYTEGGELIRPYDITTWSLPLHRGVTSVEINKPGLPVDGKLQMVEYPYHMTANAGNSRFALFTGSNNESYKAAFSAIEKGLKVERILEHAEINGNHMPAGSFVIEISRKFSEIASGLTVSPVYLANKPEVKTTEIVMPRIGIVETWFHDMDGGWLRFVFDQFHVPYTILRPADLQTVNLSQDFDILYFTDQSKSVFMNGKYEQGGQSIPTSYPPGFAKGMEKKGFENLMSFVINGGKVMAWGPSTALFLGAISIGEEEARQEFILPVRDIGKDLAGKELYVPGSLLGINMLADHPLTFGLPETMGVFHRGTPVFRTSIPNLDMDRRVIATFLQDEVLLSGYGENIELLEGEAALVWIRKGEGQLILSSFNPQFRASTPVAFKLLFNAFLLD